ncbi:hypothetical protein P43SY_000556 [Pythium insidiosum]|uniref:Calponin-homology (CH) domain-containing protein n=1 Tax=Pythium insidiosum TaxID=114742 RepID=A0AAD5LSN1_PYTIN|nr:hypothetical protein P43SY_000556 [Pythium insidiosum]
MAELLLRWINHELQLSTVVTNVERDFSSGYLLGELLYRLNLQHNLPDFLNSATADAKILNFCLLEPTMRHLRVAFDANTAAAIMNGHRGAALQVLYQVKMAAERLARAPLVSTKALERHNVVPLHNMPTKLPKPAYDEAKHSFFEHSVRRHVRSLASLRHERELKAEERRKAEQYREQQARLAEELEATKAERLHRAFLHSHAARLGRL